MEIACFNNDNKENINPISGKVSGLKKKKSQRRPLADITSKFLGGIRDGGIESPRNRNSGRIGNISALLIR